MQNSDIHLVALLDAGSHSHPGKGGCLLELVSTLPEGRWTAHPEAVDPVLGVLARAVNDRMSTAERPTLAPLIPWLACLPRTNRRDARAAVVSTAAAAAMPLAEPQVAHQLGLDVAAACGAAATSRLHAWLAERASQRAAVRVVRGAVHVLVGAAGDWALRTLLVEAINQLRVLHALPALPPLTRPAAACRAAVPIRSEILAPDGGDSTYLHSTALVESWPPWLREACLEAIEATAVGCVEGRPERRRPRPVPQSPETQFNRPSLLRRSP